jgi:iron complex outermembrane receptor protein
MMRNLNRTLALVGLCFLAVLPAPGEAGQAQQPDPQQADPLLRVRLPQVTVTAQKEPEDIQKLPVSVTAVTQEIIEQAGLRIISDAAIYGPNMVFTEFTARKLSNARFRGIGSSPNNPAVTTYFDGVPQLNANSSSIDLLAIEQIEFVRGPQGALFGRNTLGGIVNVSSIRPSFTKWTGSMQVPFGNYSAWDVRGTASGPLVTDKVSAGFSFNYGERDGYTVNDVTGNDLDYRSSFTGKGQLLWTPSSAWEARLIITGERARDGDYALNDLAALRENPFHSSRDFEGHTDRDLFATTILTQRKGGPINFSTTTGFVKWKTQDVTDLDYSPANLVVRDNTEEDFQFTQEVRLAGAAPKKLTDSAALKWQGGVFFFTQNFDQNAVNTIAPFVFSEFLPLPIDQTSPLAELDDFGFGVFGQGTITFKDNLDVVGGLRVDYENKEANLLTAFDPAVAPPTVVAAEDSFGNVSPQIAVAYRFQPERTVYGTVSRGYKAGGFNPSSPAGSEAYGEEQTWHYEGGVKTSFSNGRVSANAAAFYIDWNNLQLNVPNPNVPAQLYIANVGNASSSGIEFELNARPVAGVDVFGSFGYTHARFGDGSRALGLDISDNDVPNTPDYTASMGVQFGRALNQSLTFYGRGELVFYGAFKYDETNLEGQDAYSLANFRGGVRTGIFFAEGWIRNAFDTEYIPIAFSYGLFAPSGFVGEMGAPRTFGVSAGVRF